MFFIRYGIYHIPLNFLNERLFPYRAIIFYTYRAATSDTIISMHKKFHCGTKFSFDQNPEALYLGMRLTNIQKPGNRHMAVDM